MKIYIDDLREPPDNSWVVIRTSEEAIHLLSVCEFYNVPLEYVSFDHDLGGDDTTRKALIFLIEKNYWPEHIVIHTANPVGREYLESMVGRYGPEGILKWNYS